MAILPHLSEQERATLLPEALEVLRAAAVHGDYHEDPLIALAPYLMKSQFGEALDIIKSLSQDSPKASALAKVARYLPEPLVREALEYAHTFRNPLDQGLALAGLAPYLAEQEREAVISEALKAARKEKQPGDEEVELLVTLAEVTTWLPERRRKILLTDLLNLVAHKFKYSWYRAEVLEKLAPYLPESLLDNALRVARKIGREDTFRALLGLLPYLPETKRPAVLKETLEAARSVRQNISRFVRSSGEALTMVATQLPEQEQDAILLEALESARAASADSYDKGAEKLLSNLAVSLAAMGGSDEAMTVARSIRDQEIVVTTYGGIAPHLKQNQLSEILMEGRSLRDSSQRAKVLMAVVPYLEAQGRAGVLVEALEAAKADVSEQLLEALVSDGQLVRRAFDLSEAVQGNTRALSVLAVVCGLGIKLNYKEQWRVLVQAIREETATQEAGAVETSHANSA